MINNTADSPGVRSPWAGKAVRIEQIEEELAFLWKMSADNLRTGQNVNVRTSVLNLVICAPDTESAQRASNEAPAASGCTPPASGRSHRCVSR